MYEIINITVREKYCIMVDTAQYCLPFPLEVIHSKMKISMLLPENKPLDSFSDALDTKGPKMKAPTRRCW